MMYAAIVEALNSAGEKDTEGIMSAIKSEFIKSLVLKVFRFQCSQKLSIID